MTPNIWTCVMAAIWPWMRCGREDVKLPKKVKFFKNLHYQSDPVSGIYLVHRKRYYLVAIRPNGNGKKRNRKPLQHVAEVCMEQEQPRCDNRTRSRHIPKRKSTKICRAESIRSMTSSGNEETANAQGNLPMRKVHFQAPTTGSWQNTRKPSSRVLRKSPLAQCQNAKSEAEEESHKDYHICHLFHNLPHRGHGNDEPLQSIDVVGLQDELEVEYSPYLQRWVFTIELQKRTKVLPVCFHTNCGHEKESICHKVTKYKQLTCLDDGETWFITGDIDEDGHLIQRENVVRDNSDLYRATETNMMQILELDECKKRQVVLEALEGTFLRWDGMPPEYKAVIKYSKCRTVKCDF